MIAFCSFLILMQDPDEKLRKMQDQIDAMEKQILEMKAEMEALRFETDGAWRSKLAGGTRGTVDLLAGELRSALAVPGS